MSINNQVIKILGDDSSDFIGKTEMLYYNLADYPDQFGFSLREHVG